MNPICLPFNEHLRDMDYTHKSLFVVGWGRTQENGVSADVLQQLRVPVLENSVCSEKYRLYSHVISKEQFNDDVLCAGYLSGGRDTCQGDSGGPLMFFQPHHSSRKAQTFYQIGIVSYGIGCAREQIPSVYTRVTSFMDWIHDHLIESA